MTMTRTARPEQIRWTTARFRTLKRLGYTNLCIRDQVAFREMAAWLRRNGVNVGQIR